MENEASNIEEESGGKMACFVVEKNKNDGDEIATMEPCGRKKIPKFLQRKCFGEKKINRDSLIRNIFQNTIFLTAEAKKKYLTTWEPGLAPVRGSPNC